MAKKRTIPAIIVCALTLIYCPPTPGKIIYVDDDANGLGNGSSWQDAYKYLQGALADAGTPNEPVEVRVAQGVYRPDRSAANPQGTGDSHISFDIPRGVTLIGGFAGLAADDPSARDVKRNETILSGDLAGNDAPIANPANIANDPTRADNSHHVVTIMDKGVGDNLVFAGEAAFDGLVITAGHMHGHVTREPRPNWISGGGLYVELLVSTLKEPVPPRVTLRDCVFRDNFADWHGGGMWIEGGRLTLERCLFTSNGSDRSGGGLQTLGNAVELLDCDFIANRTTESGGGGGWACSSPAAVATRCRFTDNSAGWGGAIAGNMRLVTCTITDNVAKYYGGGIAGGGRKGEFTNCYFAGNQAGTNGGAIAAGDALALSNCVLVGNKALESGGGVSGANMDFQFGNCTFTENLAPEGRFLADKTRASGQSKAQVDNCIVNDGENEIWNEHTNLTVRYTDLRGGASMIHDPCGLIEWGPGNLDADPCFADLGYWDPNGTPDDASDDFFVAGDYHLKSQAGRWDPNSESWVIDDVTSPCIDAGDPNSSVGDEPQPNGGRINMGAYGGTVEASKSVAPPQVLLLPPLTHRWLWGYDGEKGDIDP